jgi:hypothetical protein
MLKFTLAFFKKHLWFEDQPKKIAKIFIDLSLGIVQYKKTKIILRIITQNKAVKLSLKKGNNLVHLNVAYDFQYISLKSLNYL